MLIGVIETKEPGETYLVEIDFTNDLDPSGLEVITVRQATSKRLLDDVDTTNSFLSGGASGTGAKCAARVTGGAPGERHRVEMTVTTNLGNILEHEIDVLIAEA